MICQTSAVLTLLSFSVALTSNVERLGVKLTTLSTLYLPTYENSGSSFKMFSPTLKQIAYDPDKHIIYAAGRENIHIINAGDFSKMTVLSHVPVLTKNLVDVDVCGEGVFASYIATDEYYKGGVLVYPKYQASSGFPLVRDIRRTGQQYLKLNHQSDSRTQFSSTSCENTEPKQNGSSMGMDNSRKGSLQLENNAIAVVDMATDNVTAIYGLGVKQWWELDPSDKDGGINIKEWPVYGMYQPDSLLWFRWDNQDYIVTANEGASLKETYRGSEFPRYRIDPSVSQDVKYSLGDDSKLGRLVFSKVNGKKKDGHFEKFYTPGVRSFSIWHASDMKQVFDSGSDMENKTAQLRPDIFNTNVEVSDLDATLSDTVDTRSDDRGPETETVLLAELADHAILFATNERSSTIAVYSIAKGGLEPVFETLYTDTIPKSNKTWGQLYDDRQLFGIDPEAIVFVPSRDGNKNQGVLLVGGTVTGTITAIKVETGSDEEGEGSATNLSASRQLLWVICSCVFYLHNARYQ